VKGFSRQGSREPGILSRSPKRRYPFASVDLGLPVSKDHTEAAPILDISEMKFSFPRQNLKDLRSHKLCQEAIGTSSSSEPEKALSHNFGSPSYGNVSL
jgi:hypothetical protein